MRSIRVLFTALLSLAALLPVTAHAQARATSYEFAPPENYVTDKNTSAIGHIFDDVDKFCDNFRDTKGIMMFIAAGGISVLALISGLPVAAAAAGAVAGAILLVNKPLLFAVALIPLILVLRESKRKKIKNAALDVVPIANESAEALAIRRARKARKAQKKEGIVGRTGSSRGGYSARASG